MPKHDPATVTVADVTAIADALHHFASRYSKVSEEMRTQGGKPITVPNWKTAIRGIEYLKNAVNKAQQSVEQQIIDPLKRPLATGNELRAADLVQEAETAATAKTPRKKRATKKKGG